MGVNLVPFIDEDRIRNAYNNKKHLLTELEIKRNSSGKDLLLFNYKYNKLDKEVLFKQKGKALREVAGRTDSNCSKGKNGAPFLNKTLTPSISIKSEEKGA